MPSGKTHDNVNLISLSLFIFILTWLGYNSIIYSACFAVGYIFATFLFGPDLDTYSSLYKRWGLFRFIWLPYRKIFPHRSFFTHGLIVSDIIRIAYLLGWLYLIFILPTSVIEPYFIEGLEIINNNYLTLTGLAIFIIIVFYGVNNLLGNRLFNSIKKNLFRYPFGLVMTFMMVALFVYNLFPEVTFLETIKMYYEQQPLLFILLFFGVVASSIVHSLSDILVSSFKKQPIESFIFVIVLLSGVFFFINL